MTSVLAVARRAWRALERVRAGAERLDGAEGRPRRRRRPAARAHPPARRRRGPTACRTAPPTRRRRCGCQVSTAGTASASRSGMPECERGPGQDQADRHRPDHTGAHGDRHRQQGAQVEVLEGVDVVDGAGEEVAAAPSGEGGRHARGEAVVRATRATGSAPAGRHHGRRGAPRSAAARAGRPAPPRRPGCRRSR